MFKNRKTNRPITLLGAGLILVAVSALFLVRSVAAASCFTDTEGHQLETYICWMKNHNITAGYPDGSYKPDNFITRGQMAVFMQRLISTGDIHINTGPSDWVVNASYAPTAFINHFWAWTHLKTSSNGTFLYSISPSLPSSLYNTKMYVKGAKLCYDATDAGAYITAIEIKHITYSTGEFIEWNAINDPTDLSDRNCRVVNFSSISSFWGNDQVTINVYVTFTDTISSVRVGVATVILTPSTETAILRHDDLVSPYVLAPSVDDPTSGK